MVMQNRVFLAIIMTISVTTITAAISVSLLMSSLSLQLADAAAANPSTTVNPFPVPFRTKGPGAAPIATSGDNVYVTWWSNKTGNFEVSFKASADAGKTFGEKINLSNSPKSDSQDAQIAAAGVNVYITWWERNQTMNEPIIRVSNDNGKTFGPVIKLDLK